MNPANIKENPAVWFAYENLARQKRNLDKAEKANDIDEASDWAVMVYRTTWFLRKMGEPV